MKIFPNISLIAILLIASLGMYAAAPEQQKPEREQWQKEAEAFLQGLHGRLGKKSPVQTELGKDPATWIAKMLKPGGHITNSTDRVIDFISIKIMDAGRERYESSFNTGNLSEIKPGSSINFNYESIKNDAVKSLKTNNTKTSVVFHIAGFPSFYRFNANNVFLDWSSNIEIKETTKDGLHLIVTEANESRPPVIYNLEMSQPR